MEIVNTKEPQEQIPVWDTSNYAGGQVASNAYDCGGNLRLGAACQFYIVFSIDLMAMTIYLVCPQRT